MMVAVSSDCGPGSGYPFIGCCFPLPESSLIPRAAEEAGWNYTETRLASKII